MLHWRSTPAGDISRFMLIKNSVPQRLCLCENIWTLNEANHDHHTQQITNPLAASNRPSSHPIPHLHLSPILRRKSRHRHCGAVFPRFGREGQRRCTGRDDARGPILLRSRRRLHPLSNPSRILRPHRIGDERLLRADVGAHSPRARPHRRFVDAVRLP